jgi:hypothetical protein
MFHQFVGSVMEPLNGQIKAFQCKLNESMITVFRICFFFFAGAIECRKVGVDVFKVITIDTAVCLFVA